MNTQLKYMPVLRLRQQEQQVLTQFYFGKNMYPCVEIIKEGDKPPPEVKKGKKVTPQKVKSFEEVYIPILWNIHSDKVFVDLPVHMKADRGVQQDVVKFLKGVVASRTEKTKYLIKLKNIASKIIPVVSTYKQITGEMDSIKMQENDLRPCFDTLAFRTFPITFESDLPQIEAVARPQDFLIVDIGNYIADPSDEDMIPILEKLKQFDKCHIVIVRAAMDHEITNVGLEPGLKVFEADNRLLQTYRLLHGHSFGDYAGIKKDKVNDGRGISPGFIFYNPLKNNYYGFRGSVNEEGKSNQELEDFENIILPSVMDCEMIQQMKGTGFLDVNNRGWQMLERMYKKIDRKTKSPKKFKRISMEHYLHCIRTKIDAGDFN